MAPITFGGLTADMEEISSYHKALADLRAANATNKETVAAAYAAVADADTVHTDVRRVVRGKLQRAAHGVELRALVHVDAVRAERGAQPADAWSIELQRHCVADTYAARRGRLACNASLVVVDPIIDGKMTRPWSSKLSQR